MEKPVDHTIHDAHNFPIISHAKIVHATEFHKNNSEETPVFTGVAQAVHAKLVTSPLIELSAEDSVAAEPIAYAESVEFTQAGKNSIYDAHGNKTQDIITNNGMQHITYYHGLKIIKESLSLPDGSEHLTYYPGNIDGVVMTDAMPEEHIATTGSIKQVKPTLSPVISKTVIFDSIKIKQEEIIHRADKSLTLKHYDTRGALESIEAIASDKSSIHNHYQSYPDYIVMIRSEHYDSNGHKTQESALDDSGKRTFIYYDAHGNSIPNPNPGESVINADGSTTVTDRNYNGMILLQVTTHTDGSSITLEYDEDDGSLESKEIKNADGSGEGTYYDSTGEIDGTSKTVKMPDGSFKTTEYEVDGTIDHEFITVHHADGSIQETHYDDNAISRIETKYTDGSHESIYYEDGKITSKNKINKDKSTEDTYYNDQGEITHITKTVQNGNGSSTSIHYDKNNQITSTSKTIENINGSSQITHYRIDGTINTIHKYDLDGSSENIYYDAHGKKYYTSKNNPDGSSEDIHYSSDGTISYRTKKNSDGSVVIV